MRISDWSSDVCSSDLGCEREIVAHRRQGAALAILVDHAIEDQARDQRLGFLVPMRLAALPCGIVDQSIGQRHGGERSEEHTSELQSLMRISYAVFCLKKKKTHNTITIKHKPT